MTDRWPFDWTKKTAGNIAASKNNYWINILIKTWSWNWPRPWRQVLPIHQMRQSMTKPIKWPVHSAKIQISLGIQSDQSSLSSWRWKANSQDSDQTGWSLNPMLIHVGFVLLRLKCYRCPVLHLSMFSPEVCVWGGGRGMVGIPLGRCHMGRELDPNFSKLSNSLG